MGKFEISLQTDMTEPEHRPLYEETANTVLKVFFLQFLQEFFFRTVFLICCRYQGLVLNFNFGTTWCFQEAPRFRK